MRIEIINFKTGETNFGLSLLFALSFFQDSHQPLSFLVHYLAGLFHASLTVPRRVCHAQSSSPVKGCLQLMAPVTAHVSQAHFAA